ncbi:hypothetical protein [Archangium sp.]|uniref:hypothetical protein n=1 Tax=Archangium sp. TaxID=1872627 RepID=UPI002ED7EDA6
MRTPSFRSLLLAAVLPLGLTACGPEIDENILQVCDARAPRGSDAHFQCVSHFESGAEVLPQGTQPWDVAPKLVIRDQQVVIRDQPVVIRDQQGKLPWDVAPQLVIRDQDGESVIIRDQDGKSVVIRDNQGK